MNFKEREEGYVGDSGGGKERGKCCNYIIVLKNKKKNIKKMIKFENKKALILNLDLI